MKKQLFLCLLLITAITVKAQVWSPPGATWTYSYTNQFSITGYVEIKYVGDSMVGGQLTKVLEKTRFTLDQFNGVYDTINLGKEYTYLDSNIVYYYRLGQFYTLYDFSAQINDLWIIAGEDGIGACDSIGEVLVDSTGTMIINSDTLIYLKISPKDTSDWQFGSKIAERIGCTDGYMFPEPTTCILDYNEGGPFRCYWDNSFAVYSSGITAACDFITSIDEKKGSDLNIFIYPNPTTGLITLNLPLEATRITIYNVLGQSVHEEELISRQIDLSYLKNGVYMLHITHKKITYKRKFIKL